MLTDEQKSSLTQAAVEARRRAYAPYSKYAVGAAVLSAIGQIYSAANVENAAYPLTICAERAAIFKAISEGEREFTAIAVVSSNGGTPCGACRQVMAEFGLDTLVLIATADGVVQQELTVGDLLPGAFGPGDLHPGE
ncbi:MAG TPA: cytidine deaminase [Anaerolineales bacterium]|nr:cytidine deaminase [Anaerolineales bacterium]